MIELKLDIKGDFERRYMLRYKKDNRFSWENNKIVFRKKNTNKWGLTPSGSWNNLNRECILKIESILRGLNS